MTSDSSAISTLIPIIICIVARSSELQSSMYQSCNRPEKPRTPYSYRSKWKSIATKRLGDENANRRPSNRESFSAYGIDEL